VETDAGKILWWIFVKNDAQIEANGADRRPSTRKSMKISKMTLKFRQMLAIHEKINENIKNDTQTEANAGHPQENQWKYQKWHSNLGKCWPSTRKSMKISKMTLKQRQMLAIHKKINENIMP